MTLRHLPALRQRIGNGSRLLAITALLTGGIVSSDVRAQTVPYLEAFQGIYAENGGPTGPFAEVDGHSGPNNALNPYTGKASFTGMNRDTPPTMQTMTITGMAYSYATYGQIHAYGDGTISNPYYNAANQVYVNNDGTVNANGSPDTLAVHGNAGWGDTFTYTGLQGTGYKVNYYFKLDGIVSGDAAAGLNFSTSDPNGSSYNPRTTSGSELWITPDYDVAWGTPFDVFVDFFGGITSDVSQRPEGVDYSAKGDYSDTLTLTGIQITGPNGNPVSGWSLTTASGTQYPLLQPAATPEPGSLALFISLSTMGMGMLLRRRPR